MASDTTNELSPNKQALLRIRALKQQIAELQHASSAVAEPIAIVSMACRFPRRAPTPEAFWQSLIDQTDEVTEIPADRWDLSAFHDDDPDVPGRMYARHGVFLEHLDLMDPEFFGISPREATWVDPQQRLLMEVGWEALERAGWTPAQIGEHTGIFVGWMHNDYQNEASDSFLNLNPYIATGAAGSFLCGRLAYYLGLQGPSVAVDTACSSSLVALHLACQSLQQRDCDRALVGGVNVVCSPTTNILTCKLKALSPTGQSRAFDAAADGYLRGEGCGVVTLRRLSDAERDGDCVLGVIQGSAIGHNGFSSGLTAPNPKAQEKVIRQALERARLAPQQVSYLEAHGTGTELGDPIEMRAAAAALATGRAADHPLLVGSVKTNIGHLEAAAGMAGLIKVLLSLQHDRIPGQLNFETPNPHIPWDSIPVRVLTDVTDWPQSEQRIAGVSAFGMSGTNAHVIISEHSRRSERKPGRPSDDTTSDSPARRQTELIVISARTEEALSSLADEYAKAAANPSVNLSDMAFTASVGRSHFEHRAAVVADSTKAAAEGFRLLARGGTSDHVYRGSSRRPPKVAWQFTGQGSQYSRMGHGLYKSEPVFQQAIDQCDQWLQTLRGESLKAVLFKSDDRINHTAWTQPAIFAVQMGLAQLLQSRGLQPDVVLGHSVGQYAAACVAGIMSWEDGLRLISERGRLIGDLPAGGRMLAVFAPLAEVQTELSAAGCGDAVSLAAHNGTHIVISGAESAVDRVHARFADRSIRCRVLTTSHAFHSSLMEPVLEPFRRFADGVECQPACLPLICNISGHVLATEVILNGTYWADHIRQAVRYADSIETAQDIGCELILELGPQATLTRMAAANWKQPGDRLVSCLQQDANDTDSLRQAFGQLYVHGITPDFAALYDGRKCQRILLPTYPFQRRRFWGPDKPRAFHAEFHTAHPLLGSQVSLAGVSNETRFETFLEPDSPPWLPDHEVMGHVVLPGAAWVELGLAAAKGGQIEDIVFEKPLQPSGRTALQTVIKDSEGDDKTVETFSAATGTSTWTRHFTAKLTNGPSSGSERIDLAELRQVHGEVVQPDDFYQKMHEVGLNYGPEFQTIKSLQYSSGGVLAHLQTDGDMRGFTLPPTLLDGALHSLAVGLLREDDGHLFLPVGIDRVQCDQRVEHEVWCHARWIQQEGRLRTADLTLFTETGEVVATISGLRVQQVNRSALREMSGSGAERLLYELQWQSERLSAAPASQKRWLFVAAEGNLLADDLQQRLTERGHFVDVIRLQPDAVAHSVLAGVPESAPETVAESSATQEAHGRAEQLTVSEVTAGDRNDTFAFLSTVDAADLPDGIVWLFGDNTDDDPVTAQTHCSGVLNLIQTLQQRGVTSIECGLELITTDAVSMDGETACNAQQTKYWGLGRVIGAEQPEYRCRLIDIPSAPKEAEDTTGALVEVLLTETRDNQFAIRGTQLFVPRLKQIGPTNKPAAAFAANPDGSYLITGGLGMLGRQAAKWLADRGATQVVLVSRRSPDEVATAFLTDIRAGGCEVIVESADLGARSDVARLFRRFDSGLKPLAGVIHAAGLVDDGLLSEQTWHRFRKVMAPKADGARLLDEFTRTRSLDFFVLYSSAASVLGSPGQSNYATANAFLDGLAWERRASGLPATVINWGPWTEGMADNERIVRRLALQGITPLTVAEAHKAMEHMLAADSVQAMVLDVDWRRMVSGLGGEAPPLLAGLAPVRQRAQISDSAFVSQLRKRHGSAQKELLVKTIQQMLQGILSTPEMPEVDRPLIEMGLDSLMAVEFSTQLQMMLGEQFPIGPTMLFDHPTIEAISDHVLEMVASEPSAAEPAPDLPIVSPESRTLCEREPVAIVGMSCRFPGAHDIDEFWDNILHGVDSVTEIPSDRWDIDRFYDADRAPGKMYTREGGFLEDIADFDAAFFNISDQEACWIDPQHRLLLENSYRALEHAGISSHPLSDANVGVFMGIMGQDYAFLPHLDDAEIIRAFQGAGLSHSAGVGRISYVFGFEGPSIAVDTASSSSLVALFQAMRSLQDGNCNMALAGGVNAILAPVNSLLMSKAGLLSPDGRCRSFSARAEGFGRGEGCGVVVLKRLSDAQRDGDQVLAVLRGGAVVHNGFTGSITSPSSKSQARVITEALHDAKIAPAQVQYLEAHGTGTEFGDPMELGAAASVYGKGRRRDQPLLVGSVKANISHLEAAGGISGLIKTVLSLHHGVIPPQAHFDEPSPHIPWKRLPVKMVTEPTAWPDAEERIAGVTALGLVGTNAHLIVSGPPVQPSPTEPEETAVAPSPAERPSHLLVLSARTPQSLSQLADSYRQLISKSEDLNLHNMCHTAATGRRHCEYRTALAFDSRDEAIEKLSVAAQSVSATAQDNGKVSAQPQIAWLFTGDADSQLSAAGELYAAEPEYRELVAGFDQRLSEHLAGAGQPLYQLKDWLTGTSDGHRDLPDQQTDLQVFVLQAGLACVWRSWGIEPDAVLGFGVGQYTAACVAGGLCFKDALTLIVERQATLSALDADPDSAEAALDRFEAFADQVNYYPPNLQLVCSITGDVVPVHRSLAGSYWRQHLTAEDSPLSLTTLKTLGCDVILPLGPAGQLPHPEESPLVTSSPILLPGIEDGRHITSVMLESLGRLYVAGANPDFKSFARHWSRQRVALPYYPFQKKRYWITEVSQHAEPLTQSPIAAG